ncbi:replication initiation protein [Enterobacter roggenkampii]|uniref:Replicase family n=1 Tax=Enterobacter roggenkampii TaxID=1812935 RepID=A0ABY0J9N4_9ENTR|nr:replication initiation protein [Enterobacter roggenkampii]SAB61840.1 Replicase family [Enterobacter roggenkampii]
MYEDNRQNFISQMPYKPYCSNDLTSGLTIRKREKALEMLYIQANQPTIQTCLLFDIDKENSFYTFEEVGLPVPQFITKSPDSGRCHYGYILRSGVCKTQQARLKPLKYAAAVENGMAEALGSDRAYVGLVTKNPLNSHWSPYWSGADLYDLDFLADCVDLTVPKQATKTENYGLGRNVNLFEDLRHFAYKHVLNFKKSANFEQFLNEVERQGINLNAVCNVGNLLPFSEVKATVKSICRWTWKNFDSATFSEIQSARAKKKNKKADIDNVLKNMGVL